MTDCKKNLIHHCLYFTANSLSRVITRMAEDEFKLTGLSPSHAFLMMLAIDQPGIGQKELCENLQLAPSTVTRFVDALFNKGFLTRKTEGKTVKIFATDRGSELKTPIAQAWERLYHRYADVLGQEEGDALAHLIDESAQKLTLNIK